jgi:hypothetical protein
MEQLINWRSALSEWLQNNSATMSQELEATRQEFVRRFPQERLKHLSLEEYAVGHDASKDSFCYWLEWETGDLGSVRGGSSFKWVVFWSKQDNDWRFNQRMYDSPQDALNHVTDGLTLLLDAAASGEFDKLDEIGNRELGRNRNSLRAKPLFLYFPDKFIPISNPTHLANILRYFGQEPKDGLHARNRQLLEYVQGLPEFSGFDPMQIGRFLWTYKLNEEPVIFQDQQKLQQSIDWFVRFANSPTYRPDEYDYKRDILDALNDALGQILEGKAEPAVRNLVEAARANRQSGANLTSWRQWSNLIAYLEQIPPEQIQDQLISLLDDDGDLVERIDAFRAASDSDLESASSEQISLNLGLISLMLMAHSRDDHIIYRASAIDTACEDWGAPNVTGGKRNDGIKYTQYLALIPPLRSMLTKALDRPADLIDVHSLLWFNHTDAYDQYKEVSREAMADVEERPFIQQLMRVARRTRNVILYGPPGTGKTYWASQFGEHFDNRVSFVTFHQSFAYEDFVEGLRPSTDEDGNIRYDVKDGIFKQICRRAKQDPDHVYLLVIDEINRANIAKVFGELITLVEDDKRLGMDNEISTVLPYSQEAFSVPQNLLIMGTMNTADRSIALLDIALRRRFIFIELMPNPSLLPVIDGLPLSALLERLNERINIILDRDRQIGHSYFLDIEKVADLRFAWEHRVVPLLQEYFYNNGERLKAIIGGAFVETAKISQESRNALSDTIDPDASTYQLADLSDEAFLAALKKLAGTMPD